MEKNKSLKLLPLLSLIIISLLFSCKESPTENELKYPPDNEHKVSIAQGVWGNVWFWEGDFMPGVTSNQSSSQSKVMPVIREIFIYEATTNDMVESPNSTFYSKINSNLIATTHSDADGFFQISLAPGKYSFFVKEDALLYANLWDSEGHIQSAVVVENGVTKRQININYNATY